MCEQYKELLIGMRVCCTMGSPMSSCHTLNGFRRVPNFANRPLFQIGQGVADEAHP